METRIQTSTTVAKFYDPKKKRTIPIPILLLTELKPKIIQLSIGKNSTKLKMAPKWFKYDDHHEALKNIVYPEDITENQQRTLDTVAKYRAVIGQPKNNFRKESLNVTEDNTETLIIALDDFVRNFGGELAFTNEDVAFDQAADRTACGVANLSSAHLLATDYISTAKFCFLVDLDYQSDLARSSETMQNFILSFSNAIAEVLTCPKDYVRVISVDRSGKNRGQTKVNFGLTTPNQEKTEEFVEELKAQAEKGFPEHRILKHVQPDEYECKWKPLITFFQLQSTDFDPAFNIDYRNMPATVEKRGGLPYYFPIGWYRHALKVVDKFPDDKLWLGKNNVEGEWAVAFHGTHGGAVKGITQQGFLIKEAVRDLMKDEAVKQGGTEFDKPGLYVATHCTGGAHPRYTTVFDIKQSSDVVEKFRVVFQCRVKPGAYTTHRIPVDKGRAWRFVDPEAIRPYGILVKSEETLDPIVEDVEED